MKRYKILSLTLLILFTISGWYGYSSYKEIEKNKMERFHSLQNDSFILNSWIRMFDHSLVEAQSSTIIEKRKDAIWDANRYATQIHTLISRGSDPLFHPLRNNFESFWRQSERFLYYAYHNDAPELTQQQQSAVKEMRHMVTIMQPEMAEVLNSVINQPYTALEEREDRLMSIIDGLVHMLPFPDIGGEDKAYNDFMYLKHPY